MVLLEDGLTKLGRKELQRYAKHYNIKRNIKSAEMVRELLEKCPDGVPETENEPTQGQGTPSNEVKQEEVDGGGLDQMNAGREEIDVIEGVHERVLPWISAQAVAREEGEVETTEVPQLPPPDASSDAPRDAQPLNAEGARPATRPPSPVVLPQPRRPTPRGPTPGPSNLQQSQAGPSNPPAENPTSADGQCGQGTTARAPVVIQRTVQGAPVGMRYGEWKRLMFAIGEFESSMPELKRRIGVTEMLQERLYAKCEKVEKNLEQHQRQRYQIEKHVGKWKDDPSLWDGSRVGQPPKESAESQQDSSPPRSTKRRPRDDDNSEHQDPVAGPSRKRHRTGQ